MSDQAKIRHDACLVCFAKEEGLILHDKIVEDLKMQGDVSCHTHISQCLYDMKRALVAVAKQAIKLSEEKEMEIIELKRNEANSKSDAYLWKNKYENECQLSAKYKGTVKTIERLQELLSNNKEEMNKLKEETAKKNLPNDQLDDILWKVGTAIAHIQLRRSAMLDTGKDATKRRVDDCISAEELESLRKLRTLLGEWNIKWEDALNRFNAKVCALTAELPPIGFDAKAGGSEK